MHVSCFEVEISTIKSKTKYTAFRATSCSNLWTDSKIVLNYLNNNDKRKNESRQSTDPDNWRYIKAERKPPDHKPKKNH